MRISVAPPGSPPVTRKMMLNMLKVQTTERITAGTSAGRSERQGDGA